MTHTPEFSRLVGIGDAEGRTLDYEATEAERAALAKRFDIPAIRALTGTLTLAKKGQDVAASGSFAATIVQDCAVSGEPFETELAEEMALTFVPPRHFAAVEEPVEVGSDELDEIEYEGQQIDLGEAIAQSLALAIDPYAEGPNADRVREAKGLAEPEPSGPLAEALKGLKED
jgi:uncharacterized metal-binding protein YceD (DUF177 family)